MAYNPANPYQPLNSTNYDHPSDPALNDIHQTLQYDAQGQPVIRTSLSDVDKTSTKRIKTSSKNIVFSNTFQFSKQPDVWEESLTADATSVNDVNQSSVVMTVSATPGSKVVRQTKSVMHYVPGRSAEFNMVSTNVSVGAGHRARIGVFDEKNGVFFERGVEGDLWVVVRSNVTGTPVDTRVRRTDFNIDKLDGTGPSGIVNKLGTIRTLHIEYEWYGAGDVEFAFIINGVKHPLHRFTFSNVINTSWCSTPFNPIRVELENVSANTPGVLEQYSTSYSLEGEMRSIGIPKITGIPLPGVTVPDVFVFRPVLSLRLKPTQLNAVAFIEEIQGFTTSNTFMVFRLVRNATINATTWTDHQTNESAVQVNTNATTYSGGTVIALGVVPLGGVPYILDQGNGIFQIGRNTLGTASDVYTLLFATATNNATALGTIRWREVR